MYEDIDPRNREKFFIYFSISIIVAIVTIGSIYLFLSTGAPINNENSDNQPSLASEYKNVTASEAYEIYNEYNSSVNPENNLTIIDARIYDYSCSSCLDSAFKRGHIPFAILEKEQNPDKYFNQTTDILFYTNDGSKGIEFCEQLVGKIYGNIYFLEGGFQAWKGAGYQLEKGE